MDISIVIVNYKSKDFLLTCLKSIYEADFNSLQWEVIVVDNNSGDNLEDVLRIQYPAVSFIQSGANLGMGGGNNVGIRKASGRYVVVMNPDTIACPNTFINLYDYMERNHKVGVVGPRQNNPDGSVQDSCYHWHSIMTPVYRRTPLGKLSFAKREEKRFLMKDFDRQEIREVDWLLGSFLFLRKEALDQVGLFDERFFMYFEDTDLCRRLWGSGWKVVYNPGITIVHNHNRDSAKVSWYMFFANKAARWHIKSWLKYLWKWKGSKK